MNNGELKEYLNGFPDDAPINVILANPKKENCTRLIKFISLPILNTQCLLLMSERNLIWMRKWSRPAKRMKTWKGRWR